MMSSPAHRSTRLEKDMAEAISWESFLSELAIDAATHVRRHDTTLRYDAFDKSLDQWVERGSLGEDRAGAAAVIRRNRKRCDSELILGDGLQDGFGLKTLPECIGDLTHLRVLRLVGNELIRLPASIGRLTQLEGIYLFNNRLTTLPESICHCAALERLYVAGNRLTKLPQGIGALQKLQVLSAPGNCLSKLPESIGELSSLRDLYLFDNPLTRLPASFCRLKKLERVHLGDPSLKEQFSLLVP
jgi:hypothetical protein